MGGFGFLSLRGIFLELTRRAASISVRDAFMASIAVLRTAFFFFFAAHDGREGCRSIFLPFFSILSLVNWYHNKRDHFPSVSWVSINTSATNRATCFWSKPITWRRNCRFRALASSPSKAHAIDVICLLLRNRFVPRGERLAPTDPIALYKNAFGATMVTNHLQSVFCVLCRDDCESARDDWTTKFSEVTKPHTQWVSQCLCFLF